MTRTRHQLATLAVAMSAVVLSGGGPAAADSVALQNGDTLHGTVVEQDAARVVLDHAVLGRLELSAEQVKAVTIDGDAAPAGDGAAETPPADNTPPAEAPAEPDPAAPAADAEAVQAEADAAALEAEADQRSLLEYFIDEWAGKLTIGFNGASGNTDNLNFYARIEGKRQEGNDRWTFNAQWFYGTNRGVTNRSQFSSVFTRDWLKNDGSRWFYFLRGEYKYDRFRAFESRASGFGGAGYTIFKTDDVEVNTRLGFGGTYEFGTVQEFTPEALFGGSVLNWKLTDRATITGEAIWYPSLEDSADYRITSRLEWAYKLDVASGLSLKLGVQGEYFSQTPGDRDNTDLRYYGALEIKF